MNIEVGKVYRLRSGARAKVLAHEPGGRQNIGEWVGFILDQRDIPIETGSWYEKGTWLGEPFGTHDYDIMGEHQPPRPLLHGWVNLSEPRENEMGPRQGVVLLLPTGVDPRADDFRREGWARAPWLDEEQPTIGESGADAPPHAEDR